ncbi:MAG: hypothetical protein CMQ40_05520 [Gammaproteobacteria bacterium]|nr:hypothetical protein [Gammaproteobacteria bacterium]
MNGIESPAVIGAGLMGKAIAKHQAEHGYQVLLIEIDPGQRETARRELKEFNVTVSSAYPELETRDFIIEAVFEDLNLKKEVLRKASSVARNETIIATNTSSLQVKDMIDEIANPSRFLGVHYNNPADFNPIVEIIETKYTDKALASRTEKWIASTGKHTVRCADTPCFVLNRQSLPFINEAARCLDIATAGQIDFVAKKKVGVALGPFEVMNMVGLNVIKAASRNLEVLGRGYASSRHLQEMNDDNWEIEEVKQVDKEITMLITRRLRGAMIFSGKDIIDRKLCNRNDLDMICKSALGYEKSSPEWLEILEPSVIKKLVDQFITSQ